VRLPKLKRERDNGPDILLKLKSLQESKKIMELAELKQYFLLRNTDKYPKE
jgi:hypothetical protein